MGKPRTATDVKDSIRSYWADKYGSTPENIRFEMDGWVLVTPPEGHDGLDCIHGCQRKDKTEVYIKWSYTILNDPNCPGCGAVCPDEVQGLYQLANMEQLSEET